MGGEALTQVVAPRRGRPPRAVDHELLHRAAVEVFATATYEGASVEAIALRVGVARGLLTRRFGSKEELFAWALDREVQFLTAHLMAAYEAGVDAPLGVLLRQGTRAVFEYAGVRPHGFRLLFQVGHSGPPTVELPAERVRRIVTDRVERIARTRMDVHGAAAPVDPAVIATVIVGGVEQLVARVVGDPDADVDAAIDGFVRLLLHGLAGRDDRGEATP